MYKKTALSPGRTAVTKSISPKLGFQVRAKTLVSQLAIALLCLAPPLLVTTNSWAQSLNVGNVTLLLENFKSNDEAEREDTLDVLARIGAPAVGELIKALKNENLQVRQGAMEALGRIGQPAVPALKQALQDQDPDVRRRAADALGKMGTEAKNAVPDLIKALQDTNERVRGSAAAALGNIGADAKAAVPQLQAALKDENKRVRRNAATALGNMGEAAKVAVDDLIALLNDPDEGVKSSAASTLGSIGADAKVAVPQLRAAMKDTDERVRRSAAYALGNIGMDAKAALPELRAALKDQDKDVRSSAAVALGNMGGEAVSAIPQIKELLQDQDKTVRRAAAYALGNMGADARGVLGDLRPLLEDQDKGVRSSAAYAMGSIAYSLQNQTKTKGISVRELNQAIAQLEAAVKILEQSQGQVFPEGAVANVRLSLDALKARRNANLFYWLMQNKWASGILLYVIFFPSLWLFLLWLRPLWLLRINDALKPYTDIPIPIPGVAGITLPLRAALFVNIFHYHPRVLDAWVDYHLKSVREEFQRKNTVRARKVYVPIPVVIDGETVVEFTAKDLQASFQKQRGTMLIWGEGGAGKTSLACQLARWAMSDEPESRLCEHKMIPILIEEDLEEEEEKSSFMAAIRGQLQDLTNEVEPVTEEFLERLLRQRRLLVIVDRFSELNEATREQISPDSADFLVNALVVTSRSEEALGQVTKTTLKPLRIEGNRLSSFLEAYLTRRGKREQFTDSEFFNACSRLSMMVGDRSITALLAKLYAEQLIAAKDGVWDGNMSDNIPDLMLSYLNELNAGLTGEKISDRVVQEDAKAIAWECLKQTFRPAPALWEDAIVALHGEDAEQRLHYLEERLRLINTIGAAKDQIRFALDPLAEYLAALHLLEIYGNREEAWHSFLQDALAMSSESGTIKGFLLAVRECCLVKGKDYKVPGFVVDKLGD